MVIPPNNVLAVKHEMVSAEHYNIQAGREVILLIEMGSKIYTVSKLFNAMESK